MNRKQPIAAGRGRIFAQAERGRTQVLRDNSCLRPLVRMAKNEDATRI